MLLTGILVLVGSALYPMGWNNVEVRQVCGESSGSFVLGLRRKDSEIGKLVLDSSKIFPLLNDFLVSLQLYSYM